MGALWRIQKNTDADGNLVGEYSLENKAIVMGWSLNDNHLREYLKDKLTDHIKSERNKIKTFDEYCKFVTKYGIYKGNISSCVKNLAKDVVKDDLVWMRLKGIYYLARVTEKSKWKYDSSEEALKLDASNQITNVEWIKVGDESSIPGAISSAMIRGQTLRHIWKEGMLEYSQSIYDLITNRKYYNVKMLPNQDTFYNLFSTDDSEDLLCMWLYYNFGYVCIPSTNKKSTELYECVLIEPKSGKHIYPQAKAGEISINLNEYEHLLSDNEQNEVWIFRTKGKKLQSDNARIHIADPKELYNFVGTKEARLLLPESIVKWYDYMMNKG